MTTLYSGINFLNVDDAVEIAVNVFEKKRMNICMHTLYPLVVKIYDYPCSRGYVAQILNKLGYRCNKSTRIWERL